VQHSKVIAARDHRLNPIIIHIQIYFFIRQDAPLESLGVHTEIQPNVATTTLSGGSQKFGSQVCFRQVSVLWPFTDHATVCRNM